MKSRIAPKWHGLLLCSGLMFNTTGLMLYSMSSVRTAAAIKSHDEVVPLKTMEQSRRASLNRELARISDLDTAPPDYQANSLAAPLSKETVNPDPRTSHVVNESIAQNIATLTVTRPGSGYAVVDGRIVGQGDSLPDGTVVRSIAPGSVVLWRRGGAKQVLHIENRFAEKPNAN